MIRTESLHTGLVRLVAYHCTAGAGEPPVEEVHDAWSASYVMAGSFGCRCLDRQRELVPGAVLLGRPGDPYTCSHTHHGGGDTCLAAFFDPATLDAVGAPTAGWRSDALAPQGPLIGLGEAVRAIVERRDDGLGPSLDELGVAFAAAVVAVQAQRPSEEGPVTLRPVDRRLAVESAHWLAANHAEPIDLAGAAARIGRSPWQFLRQFAAATGVTPHQYLVRTRLREAARRLAATDLPVTEVAYAVGFGDLSNFVRTFGRATGRSPRAYRQAVNGRHRNFRQVR